MEMLSKIPEKELAKKATGKRPLAHSLHTARNLIMAGIFISAAVITACSMPSKSNITQQIKLACQITAPSPNHAALAPHGLLAATYPTAEITHDPEQVVTRNIIVRDRSGSVVFATKNPYFDESDPVLSPDGKKVLFARSGPLRLLDKKQRIVVHEYTGLEGLYVAELGDGSVHRLTGLSPKQAGEEQPNWSPDERQITFVRHETVNGQTFSDVYTVKTDGLNLVRHTNHQPGNRAFRPTFSPDGRSIAYQDWTSTYVMVADGSNRRRISVGGDLESPKGRDEGFTWLPDSQWVIIARSRMLYGTEFSFSKFIADTYGSKFINITANCPPQGITLN